MAAPPPPPPPQYLPRFAWWCFERQLRPIAVARALDCSPEAARRYLMPFGHPKRRIPETEFMNRIVAFTQGEVQPGTFYASAEVIRAIEARAAA